MQLLYNKLFMREEGGISQHILSCVTLFHTGSTSETRLLTLIGKDYMLSNLAGMLTGNNPHPEQRRATTNIFELLVLVLLQAGGGGIPL